MKYPDFDSFKEHKHGFVKWIKELEINSGEIQLHKHFVDFYPTLTKLIMKARVLDVNIDNVKHKLLSWTTKNDKICGWLCKYQDDYNKNLLLGESHKTLLHCIGGIRESFNGPEQSVVNAIVYECFTLNKHFMFIGSRCEIGLGSWQVYYEDMCLFEDKKPLDLSEFISFAEEANGDRTLYHIKTEGVLLFSHDHNFKFVETLQDQPELTLYHIKGITTFTDYVETLAQQWLDWVQ